MPRCFLSVVLWLCLTATAFANNFAAEVKHIDVSRQDGYYFLAADLEYHLSTQAKEALHNGVPLFWQVKVRLKQVHTYWWDKILLKYTLRYQLQYHALLNMYRVKNDNTGDVRNFSTLSAALDSMAIIRGLPLVSANNVHPTQSYAVAIKILFQENQLPLPLQMQIIANPQWQLSSGWTDWAFSAR